MIELAHSVSGDTLYFFANTHDPSDGEATDATGTVDYRIYRQENGTAVATGSMALLDGTNTAGFYSEALSLATYDPGAYVCYIEATVATVLGTRSFPFVVGGSDILVRTTIATLASQTSFTLTAGPADDDALNGHMMIIRDSASVDQFAVAMVSDYVGSTRTVTLLVDPAIFTMAVGDFITVKAVPPRIDINVIAINGDETAPANLANMYNGTGYTDNTAPASRLQVSNIGAASGGAISFAPSEDNTGGAIDPSSAAFVGSVDSGTFADAGSGTGAHVILDSTDDIDITYGYQVGGARVATQIFVFADVDGASDLISVKLYDHVGAAWVTVGEIDDNTELTISIESKFTGTGSELGKVYLRFETDSTTPAQLTVTNALVSAVNTNQTIGYADGAIWIDTNNGTAGTEAYVNGTADNPVDSLADALTLSSTLSIDRFRILTGSSITLTGAATNYQLIGDSWTLAFGGQSIAGAFISGATVSGTFQGTSGLLEHCIINAITGPGITMRSCFFNDVSITANGAGNWYLNDCRSRVAGTASPNFDFGAGVGDTQLNLRAYSGGIELENMGDTGTDLASIEGNVSLTLNANCDGGTVAMRGATQLTDNSGNVAVTIASPNIDVLHQGQAQSATANTITLAASASATDGVYDPGEIIIVAGTGAGQARGILGYNGTSKVAVIDKDWRTNPDSTSSYVVKATSPQLHVNEGLAQAGGASTITLNANASSVDDQYVGQTVFIPAGTGQDQARIITDYNGTTKVATVHRAWETNPDSASSYIIVPQPTIGDIIAALDTAYTAGDIAAHEAQPTPLQAILETLLFLTERAVSGTTVTVNDRDGSTAVAEYTLNQNPNPESITRAADP